MKEHLAPSAFAENEQIVTDGAVVAGDGPPASDPFAAGNFLNESPAEDSAGDLVIELRTPDAEEFVRVSEEARHTLNATLLVVSREEGYGKSYFLLSPEMRLWASNQPSLSKFVKPMRLYLFMNSDWDYGVWPIRNAFDSWAISETQVAETAKKNWTRRYTVGKVRKAHTTTSIETEVVFPDLLMFGADGILARCFGDAFVVSRRDHHVIQRLMRA